MKNLSPREIEKRQQPKGEEVVLLEWTVHLLRRDPARARVVAAAMIFSSLLGIVLFRSALFAIVGPLLLFSATSEYLLPIRYKITSRRACAAYGAARLEIDWERVKRIDSLPGSVKLSPFATPNRLDNFRGVLLRFAAEGEPCSRPGVIQLVEQLTAEIVPAQAGRHSVPEGAS